MGVSVSPPDMAATVNAARPGGKKIFHFLCQVPAGFVPPLDERRGFGTRKFPLLATCARIRHLQTMPAPKPAITGPRRSSSAEAALRAEIRRVSKMTIEQRVREALTLQEHYEGLSPARSSRRN